MELLRSSDRVLKVLRDAAGYVHPEETGPTRGPNVQQLLLWGQELGDTFD